MINFETPPPENVNNGLNNEFPSSHGPVGMVSAAPNV